MKIAIFSAKSFDEQFFNRANRQYKYKLFFYEDSLSPNKVVLAKGFPVVNCFITDNINAEVIKYLSENGTRLLTLRSAGFNHVDLKAAKQYQLTVARVPAYSPAAVAEFAVGLILSLNRKIHRAYNRVRENNFSLEGLMGFDLQGKTVGIIGTGKIGGIFCRIMHGFGMNLLGYDPVKNSNCLPMGLTYTSLDELYRRCDIISLHCPLNTETYHLIDAPALEKMKPGVMLINTGRGGLINASALINALKSKKLGALGMDVYEEEEGMFFHDLSSEIIQDDIFARLQTFPNVLITSHQAFFTVEALTHIAETTLKNVADYERGELRENLITG